ncbi:hypothetical protein ES703_97686 [subsurface metagenome]
MDIEDFIIRIIKETGLSRKELQNIVNQKKDAFSGFIAYKKALYIIAKELCVDLNYS